MITHPLASFARLLPAVVLLLSGCQLESFSERQRASGSSSWVKPPAAKSRCCGPAAALQLLMGPFPA